MPDETGVPALAPCPFCQWDLIAVVPDGRGYHFGFCSRCEADGPMARTHSDAIAAWNRRVPSPASGAPVRPDAGEAARLREAAEESAWAVFNMISALTNIGPSTRDPLMRAMQDAYGSPQMQVATAVKRALAAVPRSGGEPTRDFYLRDDSNAEVQRGRGEFAALSRGDDAGAGTTTWDETNAGDALDEIEAAIQAGRAMGHGAFAIVNRLAQMLSNTHPMFVRYPAAASPLPEDARRDADRLDWLEAQVAHTRVVSLTLNPPQGLRRTFTGNVHLNGREDIPWAQSDTEKGIARAAIDAAMSSAPRGATTPNDED